MSEYLSSLSFHDTLITCAPLLLAAALAALLLGVFTLILRHSRAARVALLHLRRSLAVRRAEAFLGPPGARTFRFVALAALFLLLIHPWRDNRDRVAGAAPAITCTCSTQLPGSQTGPMSPKAWNRNVCGLNSEYLGTNDFLLAAYDCIPAHPHWTHAGLSGDTSVELVGVAEPDSPDLAALFRADRQQFKWRSWTPDGRIISFPLLPSYFDPVERYHAPDSKGSRFVVFIFRVHSGTPNAIEMAPDDSQMSWIVSEPTRYDWRNGVGFWVLYATVPPKATRIEISQKIASGLWDRIRTDSKIAEKDMPLVRMFRLPDGRRVQIGIRNSEASLITRVSVSMPGRDLSLRTNVIDRHGNEHEATTNATVACHTSDLAYAPLGSYSYLKWNHSPEDIREVQLETRPFQRITWKNIALRPSKK